jgi:hypothetical protein
MNAKTQIKAAKRKKDWLRMEVARDFKEMYKINKERKERLRIK